MSWEVKMASIISQSSKKSISACFKYFFKLFCSVSLRLLLPGLQELRSKIEVSNTGDGDGQVISVAPLAFTDYS